MKKNTNYSLIFLSTGILLFVTSCVDVSKLKYVDDQSAGTVKNDFKNDRTEKTIQPYDYLYIKIYSLDEKTNNIFNERSYSIDTELLSYAVDGNGDITVPFIGTINVKDLTINQARDKITKSLSVYLNNISVMLRFVSNKVTVLGEVNSPGQHPFFDEKVTVFQALGFAGGTAGFGDLSNITLVREKNNVIKYYTLDLTKKGIAASEYYYLLPNDVLIINPIKAKYRSLQDYALTTTGVVLTSISAVLSIILISQQLSK